jgi:regulator-associated protein of mTOR
MKTVSIAAVLCLNVGVDPPDVRRPIPSAKKQAWVDPTLMPSNSQKIAQKVSINLQNSYLKVQPKARYRDCTGSFRRRITPTNVPSCSRFKAACDPTVDCVKKLCMSMRKSTKEDRLLFHFNGHGVPKPTDAGEIWVFNK